MKQRHNPVALLQVIKRCEDLQVVGNVQPADTFTSQRHNVIDVVPDAGRATHLHSQVVNIPNRHHVYPQRSGAQFGRLSPHAICSKRSRVRGGPSLERLSAVVGVGCTPLRPIRALVFQVGLIPISMSGWVILFELSRSILRALAALVGLRR
jgi:hypothetical protein